MRAWRPRSSPASPRCVVDLLGQQFSRQQQLLALCYSTAATRPGLALQGCQVVNATWIRAIGRHQAGRQTAGFVGFGLAVVLLLGGGAGQCWLAAADTGAVVLGVAGLAGLLLEWRGFWWSTVLRRAAAVNAGPERGNDVGAGPPTYVRAGDGR